MPDGNPCRLVQAHAFQVVFRQTNPLLVGEDVMAGFNGQAAMPNPVLTALFLRIVFASPVGRIILTLPFQPQVVPVELLLYSPETVRRLAVQVELASKITAGGDHMRVMMLIARPGPKRYLNSPAGLLPLVMFGIILTIMRTIDTVIGWKTSFHPGGKPFSAMLVGMEIRGTHNQKTLTRCSPQ